MGDPSRALREIGMKIWKLALAAGAGIALSATAASAEKLTFTLNWVAGGDHAPYFYAQKMGWYKDAGVDVTFETGRGSAASARCSTACTGSSCRLRPARIRVGVRWFSNTQRPRWSSPGPWCSR